MSTTGCSARSVPLGHEQDRRPQRRRAHAGADRRAHPAPRGVGRAVRGSRGSRPRFPPSRARRRPTTSRGSTHRRTASSATGWYSREDCEVRFWKQANPLVQAPKIWDRRAPWTRRSRARTCSGGSTCTRRGLRGHATADVSGRRPQAAGRPHAGQGRCATSCKARSDSFRCSSSGDRARRSAVRSGLRQPPSTSKQAHRPTLTLVYLPHLDYNLQKFGVSNPIIDTDLAGHRSRGRRPDSSSTKTAARR